MAALLGFIKEPHKKLKQASALYHTSLLYKTKIILTKLKSENTPKIIMLKYFSLEFTICTAVELSHKTSNFAIPNLRKTKNK